MQKIQIIFGILFCLAGLFSGCNKDEGLSPEQIRYGKADTISLDFAFQYAASDQVKAPVQVNEVAVNNVNIYVFNELGDVISHRYAVGGASLSGMVIYRDMRYRIYAIANAGESLPRKTMAEVEGITRTIGNISQVADPSGGVLMGGKTDLLLLSNGQQVPVVLERCVAKFILRCDYSQLHAGVRVTVKRVQLKNAPKEIRLFGGSKASGGAVIDGEVRTGSDLNPLSGSGAAFYLFENLQGVVAPSALDNKNKEQQMSATAKANSSYIEMEYDYISPDKTGTIVYRFYLGKTFADCDVKRNTQYHCTVLFKGNGSAGENSWSVDNSQLVDRVTGIVLNPVSHTFKAFGEILYIQATVLPATAHNPALSWRSSHPAIATVDAAGKVTAVADGSCTITATSEDGTNISASCAILVDSKVLVSSVAVDPASLTLFTGERAQLNKTVLPANATVPGVAWSSSNTAVATVDMTGKVTAVAAGTADITVMSVDDNTKKAVCKVIVQSKELTIDPTSRTLYVGESFVIHYAVKPPALPSFSSAAPGVATVDGNGKVTAIGNGTTNITVSVHGLTAVCAITVVRPEIAFPYASKVMYDGEEVFIPYARLVPNTIVPTVTSSAAGVVEILECSSTGVKVKALTAGNAVITATVAGVSAACAITVEKLRIVPTTNALILYTHFNSIVNYTIHPAHAAQLPIKGEHGNSSDATYFIFPDASIPNRVQGKVAKNAILPIKLSIVGRPDVSATVYCTVKPCLEINDTEFMTGKISMLANAYFSKSKGRTYPDIYIDRQVSYTAAPQATVVWTSSSPDLKVTNGKIYTEDKTAANGDGYYITASVTGDDGVVTSFTNAQGIYVYEEIMVYTYGEGTQVRTEDVHGEPLPVFDVLFENVYSSELPGSPIKKEIIENKDLEFGGQSFSYVYHEEIYGARGDTDYEQQTSLWVTYNGNHIGKYIVDSIKKYFVTL